MLISRQSSMHPLLYDYSQRFCNALLALAGITCVCFLMRICARNRLLATVGKHSGNIYILHGYVYKLFFFYTGVSILDLGVKTILVVFVSIILGVMLQKNSYLGGLLLGKSK